MLRADHRIDAMDSTRMQDGKIRRHDRIGEEPLLVQRFLIDASAAVAAAAAVSPTMMIIDKAVIERATQQQSLSASIRVSVTTLVRHPLRLLATRPSGAMALLYLCTYMTANAFDTITSFRDNSSPRSTTNSSTKLAAVTVVNVGLALNKDSVFTRSFGASASHFPRLPSASYIPFLIRDAITLYATFSLPQLAATHIPKDIEAYASRLTIAQLLLPAASQFITTPLHLLGLDLYSRQQRLRIWERTEAARKAWLSTSIARACRIIPAYGIGGVVNNETRRYFMANLRN